MNVLVISDTHIPHEHPFALDFCKEIYKKEKCDTVIQIGDFIDWHSISFHTKKPELAGPTDEFTLAKEKVKKWYKAFPKMKLLIGNHSCRPQRLAESVNIPANFIKEYNDLWETPGWTWADEYFIDNVLYVHGEGFGGIYPAANACKNVGLNIVTGHVHSVAMVWWNANKLRRTFGMTVGSLIDDKSPAFEYAKNTARKSIIAVGTVKDGLDPQLHLMPMSKGERYARQ